MQWDLKPKWQSLRQLSLRSLTSRPLEGSNLIYWNLLTRGSISPKWFTNSMISRLWILLRVEQNMDTCQIYIFSSSHNHCCNNILDNAPFCLITDCPFSFPPHVLLPISLHSFDVDFILFTDLPNTFKAATRCISLASSRENWIDLFSKSTACLLSSAEESDQSTNNSGNIYIYKKTEASRLGIRVILGGAYSEHDRSDQID
jgi:hypothetical protein